MKLILTLFMVASCAGCQYAFFGKKGHERTAYNHIVFTRQCNQIHISGMHDGKPIAFTINKKLHIVKGVVWKSHLKMFRDILGSDFPPSVCNKYRTQCGYRAFKCLTPSNEVQL